MVVTCDEMRSAEEAAFARGVTAEALMERAGLGLAEIVRQFHRLPGRCTVVCGKGNNAGDALVAARHLAGWGWQVETVTAFSPEQFSPLAGKKFADLGSAPARAASGPARVVIDGLLGLGASGEPRGAVASAIETINSRRRQEAAWVMAVDLPSGLDGDGGRPASRCVEADLTAAIGAVKRGLVADEATAVVGRLAVVRLPELDLPKAGPTCGTAEVLRGWLPPRRFDMHKGDCGRVGIVAGSRGFLGAARMAGAAAVHSGAGLVTVFALPEISDALAAACVPEVMVRTVSSYREVLSENLDVLGIGPGLGLAQAGDVLAVVREARPPVVVDADALNAVARDPDVLTRCAGPRLLTPHPGEMERLFPRQGRSRHKWAQDFVGKYPVTLLLKGARTILATAGEPAWFNTTGNPGMASGGMGDVLTGTCAALAAQNAGGPLLRAGILGAWLCGRAAEAAVFEPFGSPESLSATTVIARLGAAFSDLRAGAY